MTLVLAHGVTKWYQSLDDVNYSPIQGAIQASFTPMQQQYFYKVVATLSATTAGIRVYYQDTSFLTVYPTANDKGNLSVTYTGNQNAFGPYRWYYNPGTPGARPAQADHRLDQFRTIPPAFLTVS